MRPQTIQIYLPTGDPSGIRQAEVTTRTVRVFDVPRSELKEFAKLPESSQSGVYFLIGEGEAGARSTLYIGESDDVGRRLGQNDATKDFWDRALVAVSLTNTWTKAHIHYLEFEALALAKRADSHTIENSQVGHRAQLPPPLHADCDEFFETIQVLVSTLGYNFMAPPISKGAVPASDLLLIKSARCEATGTYGSQGLTVFSSSTALPASASAAHRSVRAAQDQLLAQGVLTEIASGYVFAKDHTFRTPSGAAGVVLGRTSNGWNEWINQQQVTLHSLVRVPTLGA